MVAIGQKLDFNGRLRRGRCIGYIINLAAKALLFENYSDAFVEQLDGTFPINYADYQLWVHKGRSANSTIWWLMCAIYTSRITDS
jgi:hypothetical protein